MNRRAEQHLGKAQEYLEKGENFYRKAAAEIIAAREYGATWIQIGDHLDRSESWCRDIVRWAETPANGLLRATPWSGKDHADNRALAHTKRVLRESSPEQVAALLDDRQISRNLTEAALIHEERTVEKAQSAQSKRVPALVRSAQVNEVLNGMISAKIGLTRALRELQKTPQIGDEDREDLLAIVAELKLEAEWIESFLTAGTADIDSELAAILEGV